jgi:hypothetical protein
MKKAVFINSKCFFSAAMFFLLAAFQFGADRENAKQIIIKQEYFNASRYAVIKGKMFIHKRVLGVWTQKDKGDVLILSSFAKVSGKIIYKKKIIYDRENKRLAAFLSLKNDNSGNVTNYINQPGQITAAVLPLSRLQNDFLATDFSFEDISIINVENYNWIRLGDVSYRGYPCYVIERQAKNVLEREYFLQRFWITKKHLITLKAEYYGNDKKIKKRLYSRDIKKHGSIYLPDFTTVINVIKKSRSIFEIKSVIFPRIINHKFFSPENTSQTYGY